MIIKKSETPVKKHEITENNLDEFFKTHNTFEYKGEFFFKNINDQSDEDNKKIGRAFEIFHYIVDKSFASEFEKYFDYINHDYSFELKNLGDIEGFELNKNYIINFNIRIVGIRNDLKYDSKQLGLNFMETMQYSDQQWIDKYLEFLIGYGNSIWWPKYKNYNGHFPYELYATYKTKEEKMWYYSNNKDVLKYISEKYTNIFSTDVGVSTWFYRDKLMSVKAVKYEYLGTTPVEYSSKGVRAKVHLIFEYVDNPDIKSEADVEIWMEFDGPDLGEQ